MWQCISWLEGFEWRRYGVKKQTWGASQGMIPHVLAPPSSSLLPINQTVCYDEGCISCLITPWLSMYNWRNEKHCWNLKFQSLNPYVKGSLGKTLNSTCSRWWGWDPDWQPPSLLHCFVWKCLPGIDGCFNSDVSHWQRWWDLWLADLRLERRDQTKASACSWLPPSARCVASATYS